MYVGLNELCLRLYSGNSRDSMHEGIGLRLKDTVDERRNPWWGGVFLNSEILGTRRGFIILIPSPVC